MYRKFTQIPGMPRGYIHKLLLVMRLTTLILITSMMSVSAASLAQKVTLTEKKASLKETLLEIRKQTNYDFVLTDELLKMANSVTVTAKNTELKTLLDQIFKDQPLTFTIDDKTILVKEKELSIIDKIKAAIAAIDVTGRVTDENNQPLAGATVQLKDGSNSTATDANGFFTIKQVQANTVLVVSYIGYEKKEVAATANVGAIKLTASQNPLDEVKVIAYGRQTERLSVGNVSSVTAKDIEKQPVSNPLLALEGMAPGLLITQSTGMPGTGVKIQIQGQNSISSGNDPFFVVDGVPYSSQMLPGLGSFLGNGNNVGIGTGITPAGPGNPLDYLNPTDIESISILKDADATSIYGSRAANGAIIITTKKGKAGATKVDVNLQNGIGQVGHFLPMMNTQQYLQMRHEALKNDSKTPGPGDYDLNGTWDTTRNVNWQKEILGGTSHYTNYTGTVSGGSENTQFLVSTNYHRETSLFDNDFSDQKASAHFNLTSSSVNKKFNLLFTVNYLYDNNNEPLGDLTRAAVSLAPVAPPLFDSNGNINFALNSAGASTWKNPAVIFLTPYQSKVNNLISNAVLSYMILPGLQIKSSFGYTNTQVNELSETPLSINPPAIRPLATSRASYANNNNNTWIIEPNVSYTKSWKLHHFEFLLGSTITESNANGQLINGSGYSSDLLLANMGNASTLTSGGTTLSTYRYNAGFARVTYNYDEKYLISLSARRDGSSRFGSSSQFHDFGSAGVGWIFTKEKWLENNTWLNFGKLSASYGTTGNDQIGDYRYQNLYNPIFVGVPYQGIATLTPAGLPNPYLQWELTKKLNIGLDLGFFNNRAIVTANYFRNRSSNELLPYQLPAVTGFGNITSNFPATVQNTGLELSLATTNVQSKEFKWTSSFNLTVPKNKLIAFPNLARSTYANTLVIGQPVNFVRAFHFLGVNPTTGLYQIADKNGNPTTTPVYPDDQTVLIDINPKFYGGFRNTFSYKSLQLDVLLQFMKRTGSNFKFGLGTLDNGFALTNSQVDALQRWQAPGDIALYEKYTTGRPASYSLAGQSDAAYSDASFIRLKNVSLSWQVPQQLVKKVRLENVRVFAQGQNLLTFTKYQGLDPENLSSVTLPPLRVITFGLQVGL